MAQIDQYAVELRPALVVRHVLQGVEQFLKVLLVAGVDAGIAGGVDARRAARASTARPESSAIAGRPVICAA